MLLSRVLNMQQSIKTLHQGNNDKEIRTTKETELEVRTYKDLSVVIFLKLSRIGPDKQLIVTDLNKNIQQKPQ